MLIRIAVPRARRGDPVTADAWERMRAANRMCRLIAGNNVRLTELDDGTIINFTGGGADFVHSWLVTLRGLDSAVIRPGTVNRFEATIKGVPLSGHEGKPVPVLKFGKPRLDKEGRGYIAVEVTCNPKTDFAIVKAEIVQVADPDTEDGGPRKKDQPMNTTGAAVALKGHRARHALAMLRLRKSGRLDVHQITCFDLAHRVDLAEDRKTAARHFFY